MILRGQCCCFQITVDSSKTVFIVSKKNAKPAPGMLSSKNDDFKLLKTAKNLVHSVLVKV